MSKHTSFSVTTIDDDEDEDKISQRTSAHVLLLTCIKYYVFI